MSSEVISGGSAADVLGRLVRTVLAPREPLSVDELADRFRVLAPQSGGEPGPWRTDRVPYARGPMRAFTNPDVDEISIAWAAQTGKTETMLNCLAWIHAQDPAATLWLWPNEVLAVEFMRDRLMPAIRASPTWAQLLGNRARDKHAAHIRFANAGCDLWLKGAGSDAQAKSKPAKYRFADEIDSEQFDPGMLHHARARAAAWPGGKFVKASTPSLAGYGIDGECVRSRCHWYCVPCPHCLEYQRLHMSNVRWDGGGTLANAARAERTAYYVCERCGSALYDHDKQWMISRGVWVAGENGAVVREPDAPAVIDISSGGYVCGITLPPGYRRVNEPAGIDRHIGFRLSALYSPWVGFGAIARAWCEHDGRPPRQFFNEVLAEAWSPEGDRSDPSEVLAQCISVDTTSRVSERASRAAGAYRLGEVPPGVLVLTGGIDVQRDKAYYVVRGWGERCMSSWLIWFGVVPCPFGDESASAAALDRVVTRIYGTTPESSVGVSRWAIDSGEGLRTAEIYRFARRHPGRVIACKGQGGDMVLPSRKVRLDKFPDGAPIPGGLTLLHVNTWRHKGQILGRMKQSKPTRPDDGDLKADIASTDSSRWWWPDPNVDAFGTQISEDLAAFVSQVTSEQLIIVNAKAVERGARPIMEWRLRPGRRDNHYLDCEVYCQAIAESEFGGLTRAHVDAARRAASGAPSQRAAVPRPRVSLGPSLREVREQARLDGT